MLENKIHFEIDVSSLSLKGQLGHDLCYDESRYLPKSNWENLLPAFACWKEDDVESVLNNPVKSQEPLYVNPSTTPLQIIGQNKLCA